MNFRQSKCYSKLKIIDKLVIYKLLAGNISTGSVRLFSSFLFSPLSFFQFHREVSREGQRPKVTFIERSSRLRIVIVFLFLFYLQFFLIPPSFPIKKSIIYYATMLIFWIYSPYVPRDKNRDHSRLVDTSRSSLANDFREIFNFYVSTNRSAHFREETLIPRFREEVRGPETVYDFANSTIG